MRRLIDVTHCLAKSGKPFRGHHENMSAVSKGLFLDFIDVLKKYDNVLANHLEKGALNAKYLSNLSIMADETLDVGHHEQMSVIIRYFDEEKCQPMEHFIGLRRLLSVTSEAIFNSLSIQISNLNIEWKSVIAVCFDEASAMSGKFNGVQAKVKELNPNISYVHCYGHCLNLVLVDCLEISETTTQPDVRVKANGIIYQMKSYNFIFALYVMKPLLAQIQIVSAKLQTPDLNLLSAVTIVQALKTSLISLRSDEDEYSRLYNNVLDVCKANQIEISNVKHRKCIGIV
ncbi:uncharacterized protein LOC132951337 [Metopolophium dirhodum]|uniref:uncharacterized protein LOC132951337 n=1 Tax=Metopolophium dirhodum TaxID=44670 RepID=UPI00298F5BA7|nr:uncharacterized protein LOC132951337 [Metopolophium dirhodum]